MNESGWNQRLNAKLKPGLREVWKVMTSTHNGIADNYYLGEVNELWMEAKIRPYLPKRSTTLIVPDLSFHQNQFCTNQHEVNDNALVVMAVKKVDGYSGAVAFPYFNPDEWENGLTRDEAVRRLLRYDDLVACIWSYCNSHKTLKEAFAYSIGED